MAPAATSAQQRPGMPAKGANAANKASAAATPPQRSSAASNAAVDGINKSTAASQQQAARLSHPAAMAANAAGAAAAAGQPPSTFVALEQTVKMILQQTGYVLNGPGRIEERRDAYQAIFGDLHLRFQQLADRLDDEVCHAKQVVRSQYALHFEMQRRRKRQREEEEEQAAELARKRQKEEEEEQVKKEKDRLELEAQQQRKKQEEEEEAEKQRLARLAEPQNSQDVVMLDSPADTPQAAGSAGKAAAGSQTSGAIKAANGSVVATPADSADGNMAGSADFDIDSLFGLSTAQTGGDASTGNASNDAFADPSADVASLIPGIESYASMDSSQTGTTIPAAVATATAPDVMDFSTPEVNGAVEQQQAIDTTAAAADTSTTNFDDDFLNFMNDTSGDGLETTGESSFDDWLKDMQ